MKESEFVVLAYNNCQDVVKITDQKVTAVIALTAILATLLGNFVYDLSRANDIFIWLRVMLWILSSLAGLTLIASLVSAGIALLPRRPQPIAIAEDDTVDNHLGHMFWVSSINDRIRYPTVRDYVSTIRKATDLERNQEIAYQTMAVASILGQKLPWSRRSVILLVVGSYILIPILAFLPYVHCRVPTP